MKTILSAAIIAAMVSFTLQSKADTVKNDTTKVGKVTRKVGHQVSNTAANTASHVVDKKYDGKYGPHGETVYINDHSHYYYINKKGHRVYLKKTELMDTKMK